MKASTGKRPWYQFSLRTLLLGAGVKYDWQVAKTSARGPDWIREAFGGDVFDEVAAVTLRNTEVDNEDLRWLAYLKGLKKLDSRSSHQKACLRPLGLRRCPK